MNQKFESQSMLMRGVVVITSHTRIDTVGCAQNSRVHPHTSGFKRISLVIAELKDLKTRWSSKIWLQASMRNVFFKTERRHAVVRRKTVESWRRHHRRRRHRPGPHGGVPANPGGRGVGGLTALFRLKRGSSGSLGRPASSR